MTGPTGGRPESVAASALALTLIVEPDGRLRAVAHGGRAPAESPLLPGMALDELVRYISGASADPARWAQELAQLRADPSTVVRFEITVDPTANATQQMLREVVATPVRATSGNLDCVVLQLSIGRAPAVTSGELVTDHFEDLAEAMPALLWVSLPDGSLEYLSPEWERFTGTPVRQLLANGYYELIHPDDLAAVTGQQLELDDDDRFNFPAFRLKHVGGGYRWVDTIVTVARDGSGEIRRLLGVTVDAASKYDAELAGERMSEQLAAALEVSRLGRFDADLVTGTARLDARAREVLGLEPGDFDAPPLSVDALVESTHPDDQERVRTSIERVLDGTDTEYRMQSRRVVQTPAGPLIRTVLGVGRVERRGYGEPHFVGVIGDLTQEAADAAAGLRAQKREALGTLAGGIAHDFNNLISAITMSADVLEAEVARGGQPDEGIAEIRRAADRAAGLVRRLVSLSQDSSPKLVPVDLPVLAREVCALLRPTLPRNVELVPPSPTTRVEPVRGSAPDLRQALLNLIDNAAQTVEEGSDESRQIEVKVDTVDLDEAGAAALTRGWSLGAGRYVRLCVTDDGPGIPPDLLTRIFDPFFTTRRPGGGTGLGLTATQSIVRGHGGAITAENRLGTAGAEFTMLLPPAGGDD